MGLLLLILTVVAVEVRGSWRDAYLGVLSPSRCAENEQIFTSSPHVAGSQEDWDTAMFVKERMEEAGLRTWVHTTNPLLSLPGPGTRIVMHKPVKAALILKEAVIAEDPTTSDDRVVPPFNAYSANGSVTAPLVYVKYGRPEDYEALAPGLAKGVIVLVRYGKLFRGLKVRIAQQYGAVGVIIYSDPADDGFVQGPVFPAGPWRPPSSVQRGSAQFLSICPGDPNTPQCNGTLKDHIPSIPVQPIGYGDALILLQNIGGAVAPPSFIGGLNLTYRVGGSENSVSLSVDSILFSSPIWSVCGQFDGDDNDTFVLMGNHRDAWTFGGSDPNSGTSVMLEVIRGLGVISNKGFKPQRSIRFCSWDGEEYGLLGSTAYALDFRSDLQASCIAYLNTDVGVGGTLLRSSISPLLKGLFQDVISQVTDPLL